MPSPKLSTLQALSHCSFTLGLSEITWPGGEKLVGNREGWMRHVHIKRKEETTELKITCV